MKEAGEDGGRGGLNEEQRNVGVFLSASLNEGKEVSHRG